MGMLVKLVVVVMHPILFWWYLWIFLWFQKASTATYNINWKWGDWSSQQSNADSVSHGWSSWLWRSCKIGILVQLLELLCCMLVVCCCYCILCLLVKATTSTCYYLGQGDSGVASTVCWQCVPQSIMTIIKMSCHGSFGQAPSYCNARSFFIDFWILLISPPKLRPSLHLVLLFGGKKVTGVAQNAILVLMYPPFNHD